MNTKKLTGLKRYLLSALTLLFSFGLQASEWDTAEIIRAMPSSVSDGETRITIKLPDSIPLDYWYTCNFYNQRSEIIASAHHVLRERVPTTNIVVANPGNIYFVLCKKG